MYDRSFASRFSGNIFIRFFEILHSNVKIEKKNVTGAYFPEKIVFAVLAAQNVPKSPY